MLSKSKLMQLIPPGLMASGWTVEGDDLIVDAHSISKDAACPGCGVVSRHLHSRYQRTLRDLPAHGRRVLIRVSVRRFRCAEAGCPRKTFVEPLANTVEVKAAECWEFSGGVHPRWLRTRSAALPRIRRSVPPAGPSSDGVRSRSCAHRASVRRRGSWRRTSA